jgi:hypothetical protein
MKKLRFGKIFLIFSVLLFIIVISTTILYIISALMKHESIPEICLMPAFFLCCATIFGTRRMRDIQMIHLCTEYALGKIVARKYIHEGKIAGYVPIVRFEALGEIYTVEVNIINNSWCHSTNCTVGDDYYLLYNPTNPKEIIPCSSGAEDLHKTNKILTIVFYSLTFVSYVILLVAVFGK